MTLVESILAGDRAAAVPVYAAAASPTGAGLPLAVAVGADVNATQSGGFTALHEAAHRGDAAMAELLLGAGADPGQRTEDGRSPADVARADGHPELADRLDAGEA